MRVFVGNGHLFLLVIAIWLVFVGGASTAFAEEEGVRPDLLGFHNEARSQSRLCGEESMAAVAQLQWSDELAEAALDHARDAATNSFRGHEGSDGSTLRQRVVRHTDRFGGVGENIAYFSKTSQRAVNRWLSSEGHCRNIMKESYTHMGGAVVSGPAFSNPEVHDLYWVVVYGSAWGDSDRDGEGADRSVSQEEGYYQTREASRRGDANPNGAKTFGGADLVVGPGGAGFISTEDDPFLRGHQFHVHGQLTFQFMTEGGSRPWLEPGLFADLGMAKIGVHSSAYIPLWQMEVGAIINDRARLSGGFGQRYQRDVSRGVEPVSHAALTGGYLYRGSRIEVEGFVSGLFELVSEDALFRLGLNIGYRI